MSGGGMQGGRTQAEGERGDPLQTRRDKTDGSGGLGVDSKGSERKGR